MKNTKCEFPIEYTTSTKGPFFLWLFLVLLWALSVNFYFFSDRAVLEVGYGIELVRVAMPFATVFMFIVAFSIYLTCVIKEDRLDIYYFGKIKLPLVLVGGGRINRFFAVPFSLAPSTILFSEIDKIEADTFKELSAISIKLINGKKFRLIFSDDDYHREFFQVFTKCLQSQGKILS